MKKFLLIAMVMCIAIPALAVTIGLTDNEDGTGTIYYTAAAGEVVRGIALKVTLSGGVLVDDPVGVGATSINAEFNVFMDDAWDEQVNGDGYTIGEAGSPLAKVLTAGPLDTIAGADEFSICMGVIDDTGPPYNQAGASDDGTYDLLTIEVNSETEVTIEVDAYRGGIVGDNIVGGTIEGGTILMNPPPVYDFGDAPATYAVLLAHPEVGASHIILTSGNPFLGPGGDEPDDETDGQPNATATGDDINLLGQPGYDDEDGQWVSGITTAVGGGAGVAHFEVNGPVGPYQVDVWVDLNDDGDWDDLGEDVLHGQYAVGIHDIPLVIDAGAVIVITADTCIRFRINDGGELPHYDDAANGEVEDYCGVVIDEDAVCPGNVTDSATGFYQYFDPGPPPGMVSGFDINLWNGPGAPAVLDIVDVQAIIMLLKDNGWSVDPASFPAAASANVTDTATGFYQYFDPGPPPGMVSGFDINLWNPPGAPAVVDITDVQALILLLKETPWSYACP